VAPDALHGISLDWFERSRWGGNSGLVMRVVGMAMNEKLAFQGVRTGQNV
jgi:hypothetical protein